MDKDYAKKVPVPPKPEINLKLKLENIFDEHERKILAQMRPEERTSRIKECVVSYAKTKGVSKQQLNKASGKYKLSLDGEKINSTHPLTKLEYVTSKLDDKIREQFAKQVGIQEKKRVICYFMYSDEFKKSICSQKTVNEKFNLAKMENSRQLLSQGFTQEFLNLPLRKIFQLMGVTPKTNNPLATKRLDVPFIDLVSADTVRLSKRWQAEKNAKMEKEDTLKEAIAPTKTKKAPAPPKTILGAVAELIGTATGQSPENAAPLQNGIAGGETSEYATSTDGETVIDLKTAKVANVKGKDQPNGDSNKKEKKSVPEQLADEINQMVKSPWDN